MTGDPSRGHNERGRERVFLVGFMGAGKTTVGRSLAEKLRYSFLDLDDLIERRMGRSVQAIFAELGEAEFRIRETEAIASCRDLTRAVIALGGGAYVSEKNRALLDSLGVTIWLVCPLEVCLARVGEDAGRPLLKDREALKSLLEARQPAYRQADYAVSSEEGSPAAVADRIIKELKLLS